MHRCPPPLTFAPRGHLSAARRHASPLKLYILKSSVDDIQQWWGTAFQKAVSFQPAPFGAQQINSDDYYCFDICILNATWHSEFKAGFTSESQLWELYDRNEGFSITIKGTTPVKLTISWHQVVEFSRSLLFFGPRMNRNRWYSDMFHGISSLNRIRAVYMWMATEAIGDSTAAYAMSNVYLSAENELLHKHISKPPATSTPITNETTRINSQTNQQQM
jgi:hypothetical protein